MYIYFRVLLNSGADNYVQAINKVLLKCRGVILKLLSWMFCWIEVVSIDNEFLVKS